MSGRTVLIAGTGQAGFQAATSLRQEGFDGRILMVGDEPGLPYQRPPLSKGYIKDGIADRLLLRNADFYAAGRIDVADGARIGRIDRRARQVELRDGRPLAYTDLILATGARNRRLPVEGANLDGVLELRTIAHADRIRAALASAGEIVVIGGGFIGLEVAATAAAAGGRVTVLEATARLMSRVVSRPVSDHFRAAHTAAGVVVRTGTLARRIVDDGNGRAAAVETDGGERIPADLVLVAAGVVPNAELAVDAGLDVADGIAVDGLLLTSDPSISAIGDCASFVVGRGGGRTRLESVQNAVDQAKTVARRIAGQPEPYDKVPWFWSDQGAEKLQIAGLTAGSDHTVVRTDPDRGRLTVWCFAGGRLAGVETVNAPGDHMAARRLLARESTVTLDEAVAVDFDMAALRELSGR